MFNQMPTIRSSAATIVLMNRLCGHSTTIALLAFGLSLGTVLRAEVSAPAQTEGALVASQPAAREALIDEDAILANLILLAVTVIDERGQAVAGADVVLDGRLLGRTDVTGRYYLARKPISPGVHALSVSYPEFDRFTRPITLPSDSAPGIALTIRLTRNTGKGPSGDVERGGRDAGEPNYQIVQIFYVTDRRDSGSADPMLRYVNERAAGGMISKGTCDVSIPRVHQPGSLESPSWVHLEFHPDPSKHVMLRNVNALASDSFYQHLSDRVSKSKEKEVVVFIHGFNNSFEEAARKMAQLTWDLQFDGAPILYSWPSRNKLLGYTEDEDTVVWTAFHLRAFLEELAERSSARKIHLIAHSMGNRALTTALQIIAVKRQGNAPPLYDQVVLAAPDIGADTMELLAREVRPVAKRMTLYASDSDDALILSKYLHGGGLRAGGKDTFLLIAPGIDTIDASAARTDFMGHAYFDNSANIITDIQKMFSTAASPEARRLIPGFLRDLKYWIFPATVSRDVQIR
jgi:esterase/lipase superfamily enzyme